MNEGREEGEWKYMKKILNVRFFDHQQWFKFNDKKGVM